MRLHVDRDPDALGTRVLRSAALIAPLDATTVTLRADTRTERLARANLALVPARLAHSLDVVRGGATAVVTLEIEDADRRAVVAEYAPHVPAARFGEVLGALRLLPRTRWVDELIHRYVFERDVCEKHGSAAARFLETELTKELFFLGSEQAVQRTRASVVFEGDAIAARAKAWLEEHLFEPFSAAALGEACAASESTVLRAFRKQHGAAPLAYLRARRLEEAMLLLESGRYDVTEVATRVGYDNPSAFAAAFRRAHGVAPSSVRPVVDARALLPAHGQPPRRPRRRS